MIFVVYLFCFVTFVIVAYLGLPPEIRELIDENCRNSHGRLKARYVIKEGFSVMRFYAQTLFAAFLIACVGLIVVALVDELIEVEIIVSVLERADLDPEQWRKNVTTGPNSPKEQVTGLVIKNGGTKADARQLMLFAWSAMPIVLVLSFACLIPMMQLTSKSYQNACRDMRDGEASRNLRRMRQRYLRDSAQAYLRIRQRKSEHPSWTER